MWLLEQKVALNTRFTQKMTASDQTRPYPHLFLDDHRLWMFGLLLPNTQARHLGPGTRRRTLTSAERRDGRNWGQDADAGRFRAGRRRLHRRRRCAARWWDGRCSRLRGQGAIHPGDLLRSFRWGHVRQLDRVSRQLLARAWAAGAGPGDSPLTICIPALISLHYHRSPQPPVLYYCHCRFALS